MRILIFLSLILFSQSTSAQLIGRKKPKFYLSNYDSRKKDGTILFEIDVRMIDVIESITISNRKKFGKKSATVRIGEDHYRYTGQAGFIVRAELCQLRKIVGRFSDTATVDIKIRMIGEGQTWEKSFLLDKRKLRKAQYINFR